jgi:Na+/citrate or Na+/malate symporter
VTRGVGVPTGSRRESRLEKLIHTLFIKSVTIVYSAQRFVNVFTVALITGAYLDAGERNRLPHIQHF